MGEERKRVSVPPHAANPRRGRSTGTRRTPSRQHHPLITARPPTSCSSPLLPPQTHLNPKSNPYQSKWSRLVRAIHFSIWNSPSASIFIDQTPASSKDLGVSTFEHLERSASLSACLLLSTALPPGTRFYIPLAVCSRALGSGIEDRSEAAGTAVLCAGGRLVKRN